MPPRTERRTKRPRLDIPPDLMQDYYEVVREFSSEHLPETLSSTNPERSDLLRRRLEKFRRNPELVVQARDDATDLRKKLHKG